MEIDQAEILFAQKLSCGEPGTRKKAFKKLEDWLKARSNRGKPFEKNDFLKLWKGLHYCLWLQDKPLLQEYLVDNITKLLDVFKSKEQKLLFIETYFEEMSNNWYSLDQWRMDKYMMFYRRFFRRILFWLKSSVWDKDLIDDVFRLFNNTVWIANPASYPEGLKTHFASVYLDELDNAAAGELSYEQTFKFLEPYVKLLGQKGVSDIFFTSILNDIFKSILEFVFEEMSKTEEPSEKDKILAIDLEKLKTALFVIGKSPTVTSNRRSQIYAYVKNFEQLINGVNPFYVDIPDMDELDETQVDEAAETLVKRRKPSKKRKLSDSDGDEGANSDSSENIPDPFIQERHAKKQKRKKFNKKSSKLLQKRKSNKKIKS